MAHELDRNTRNGKLAMFSVNELPWHREGVLLNEAPSLDEALVLSGTDFEVAPVPVFIEQNGVMVQSPTGRAIVRLDRNTTLGHVNDVLAVVSERYVPLQNRDAFGVLEPLLDKGVALLETGGTLRGGKDVWMLVRFNVDDPVVREVFADEVIPFGLITNNHAGEARALVMETPIRVVCANTLGAALDGRDSMKTIRIAHRGDARVKLIEAAESLFGGIVERYRTIAETYRDLKATIISVEQFTASVLDVAAPLPPKPFTLEGQHLTSRGYDASLEAAQDRRGRILDMWDAGAGHTGDHSAWEAYNAAVEVIDHDSTRFRTRGSRVAAMIGGRLMQKKGEVLNALVELAR